MSIVFLQGIFKTVSVTSLLKQEIFCEMYGTFSDPVVYGQSFLCYRVVLLFLYITGSSATLPIIVTTQQASCRHRHLDWFRDAAV